MVSLRGSTLRLIALRGRFALDGQPLQDLELRPGLEVVFATGLSLRVHDVVLPHEVLVLEGDGLARHVLAGVNALYVDPRPRLAQGLLPDAPALLWHDGLGWVLRLEGEDRPLVAGDTFQIGDTPPFAPCPSRSAKPVTPRRAPSAALIARSRSSRATTRCTSFAKGQLTARARPPRSPHPGASSPPSVCPCRGRPWRAKYWDDEADVSALRRRFDASLSRLRQKLREARLRADLIRADGAGNFELNLLPADVIQDETSRSAIPRPTRRPEDAAAWSAIAGLPSDVSDAPTTGRGGAVPFDLPEAHRYRRGLMLGEGGMGRVMQAFD